MLFVLADVYRIATLRRAEPALHPERNWPAEEKRRRRGWFSIAGLRL